MSTNEEILGSLYQGGIIKKCVTRNGSKQVVYSQTCYAIKTLAKKMSGRHLPDNSTAIFTAMFSATWADDGIPTFWLDSKLAAALVLSDLPEGSSIHPPYSALLIRINGSSPITCNSNQFEAQDIEFLEYRYGSNRHWETRMSNRPINGVSFWSHTNLLDINTATEKSIKQRFKGHLECVYLTRLLANLFAYIATQKQHGTFPKPTKPQQGALKGASVYHLGRDISLPPGLIEEARRAYDPDHIPQYKIKTRHIVRGHWRNQLVGPQRSQTKRLWVQPYWKGDEDLQAVERTYQVS